MPLPADSHLLPEDEVRALYAAGEYLGTLVVEWLDTLEDRFAKTGRSLPSGGYPLGFLMEAAALAQLQSWERCGFLPSLEEQVPSYEAAYNDLITRIRGNPHQFTDASAATLFRRLNDVWMANFLLEGPLLLGADVLISNQDIDSLVDALAPILFDSVRSSTKADHPEERS